MHQIPRTSLILRRSVSSAYPLCSCGPPRLCGCTPKPKKRGILDILRDPCGVKPDPCNPCPPPITQSQKICKLFVLGARLVFVSGLVYWSYQQGVFSGAERRSAFFERLRAAGDVLIHGPKICDPKKCPGCCKCEGGPIMQRLRAALCFLRFDAMSPSEVERAIKCKSLPMDFRRCDSCSLPPPPPCPKGKPFTFQVEHWAPTRCIFSKTCPCGARPDDAVVAQVMKERKYDEVEYVDDYYKILKEDAEEDCGDDSGGDGKSRSSEKRSQSGAGGDDDDGGGDDGGGDDFEEEEEEE